MAQLKARGLRKTVGVQRARTVRTRPMFLPWSLTLEIEVDPDSETPDSETPDTETAGGAE